MIDHELRTGTSRCRLLILFRGEMRRMARKEMDDGENSLFWRSEGDGGILVGDEVRIRMRGE